MVNLDQLRIVYANHSWLVPGPAKPNVGPAMGPSPRPAMGPAVGPAGPPDKRKADTTPDVPHGLTTSLLDSVGS